jgi:hypothetical protein
MKKNIGGGEVVAGIALIGIIGIAVLLATSWVLQLAFNGGVVGFAHSLGFEQVREVNYWTMFGTTVFAALTSALLRSNVKAGE